MNPLVNLPPKCQARAGALIAKIEADPKAFDQYKDARLNGDPSLIKVRCGKFLWLLFRQEGSRLRFDSLAALFRNECELRRI